MNDVELERRLCVVEDRSKSNSHRLKTLEQRQEDMTQLVEIMAVVNLLYAPIVAQLLFGDLYSSRMCNMLHAFPLRRENWFVTHVVSGLAFSFGPNLLMTLAALVISPFSNMVNAWQIPLLWLLGSTLEFVFFFGVACLAALCVGSRFAQAVVYGIVNFLSPLAWFLVDTLYTPLLFGVRTNEEPFLWFCPVAKMAATSFIDCNQLERLAGYDAYGHEMYSYYGEFTLENTWWYLFLCAAVGFAFLAIALSSLPPSASPCWPWPCGCIRSADWKSQAILLP